MTYSPTSHLGQAVQGVLERLVALQLRAVADVKNAVPYPYYAQDSWPYWINHLDGLVPQTGDRRVLGFTLHVDMRLVLGHVENLYAGQFQADANLYAPDVLAYFVAKPRLADPSAADPALHTPPRWLAPAGCGVRVGRLGLEPIDAKLLQVYFNFPLTAPLNVGVE